MRREREREQRMREREREGKGEITHYSTIPTYITRPPLLPFSQQFVVEQQSFVAIYEKEAIDLKSVVFDEESKSGPGGWHGHGHAIHPCQRDSVLW